MKMSILFPAVIMGAGLLWGDAVTYTVTPSGAQFFYQFTLNNTGATGGALFDLFLSIPTDISRIDTATIGTPAGWGDGAGGLLFFGPDTTPNTSFIDWVGDASMAFDLGIGDSLSGFSFNASQLVGTPITFALNGSTEFAAAQEVPEPATFGLLAAAVGVIGFRLCSRRAR